MKNICELPDDCLMLIFRGFALPNLIGLRAICVRWRDIIESMLAMKRSLKLFASRADIEQYCNRLIFTAANGYQNLSPGGGSLRPLGFDDDLIVRSKYFDFKFCDLLATLFSSIDHLVICIGAPKVDKKVSSNGLDNAEQMEISQSIGAIDYATLWRHVPYLLKLWPDLSALSLHGYAHSCTLATRLSLAIDSLFSLTNLDLTLHFGDQQMSGQFDPFELPQVWPQLEQLSISLHKFGGSIERVVAQLRPQIFRKLNLEWENLHFASFAALFEQINPPLANSITHLTLRCVKGNEYLDFVCSHFVSLRYLNILFSSLTMFKFTPQVASNLKRISHLVELRIAAIHIHVEPTQPLPAVPTIRTLELAALNFSSDCEFKFKAEKFCKMLSTMFPSVEKLIVRCNRPDVMSQIGERLHHFKRLQRHKIFDDYAEHRDYLGKYRNVNEQFLLRRISFE